MERDELEKLIYRILATEEEEIDCEQVFELIAQYVDLEVSGADARRLLPLVSQHLKQCDGCYELHETLFEIALLEEEGKLPDADELLGDIIPADAGAQAAEPGESPSARPSAGPVPSGEDEPGEGVARRRVVNGPVTLGQYRAPRQEERLPFWQRWPAGLAWATAAIALIIALGAGVWGWSRTGQRIQADQHLAFIANADWLIRLKGTQQAPDAHGFVFVDADHQRALVLTSRLKPLPRDRAYQVWVHQGDQIFSGGTFQVEPGVWETVFYVDFDRALSPEAKIMVTEEPGGGSPAPTSSSVLQGMKDY